MYNVFITYIFACIHYLHSTWFLDGRTSLIVPLRFYTYVCTDMQVPNMMHTNNCTAYALCSLF